jgi:hypothetical protein
MAWNRILLLLIVLTPLIALEGVSQSSAPLRVDPNNPRYFIDGAGAVVYLAGSHAWLNFQDGGFTSPPPAFDYTKYLDFLVRYNHNFTRLWTWEEAKWIQEYHGDYFFDPMPYQRTGPGTALDGKPKFDLTKFNQAYFDRLRQRCVDAGNRGIYVSVMLFDGWSVMNDYAAGTANNTPFNGHPMNAANNINGINGDPSGSTNGKALHTMQLSAARAFQEAYIRKVIDTINDLNNVLFEISNESFAGSTEWQYYMINFIKAYEKQKPKQHPVGMTAQWPDDSTNAKLFASPADWISPNWVDYFDKIPAADGSKVILLDTDHVFGIGGNRAWIWKSFLRGMNVLWMDVYDRAYPWPTEATDDTLIDSRKALGYTVAYSRRMNIGAMKPRQSLSSTLFCLACTDSAAPEYLVYSEWPGGFTVDLSATKRRLHLEWFDPSTGKTQDGGFVTGGAPRTFFTPFAGDAVAYLVSGSVSGVTWQASSAGVPADGIRVDQNYPNPFNPSTVITFVLGAQGRARLTIYDMRGAETATLVNEDLMPGTYSAHWNATAVPSGIYFYRLDVQSTGSSGERHSTSVTKKLLLVK